ncbi:MAG TPA: pilus assembly protein TadG-related protein [Xanthobacteraceae bacterium]
MSKQTILRFVRDRSGNVTLAFALFMVPIFYVSGLGFDYMHAADQQAKLNALADAAALAAVTPAMMAEPDAKSIAAAQNTFNSQATLMQGIVYNPSANLVVTVTDQGVKRTVTVSYTASSQTSFGGLVGASTIALSGSSQAVTQIPPNVDFYLLLDNSPSMAIAATTDGINTMVANTQPQGGCAFACHESNPQADNLQNKNPKGKVDNTIDNYQLARNLGVTLRIDQLASATQNLMTTAQNTMTSTNATYRTGIFTFNNTFATVQALTSNLGTAQTAAGGIGVLEVYKNNWITSTTSNSDEDTDFDNAMSSVNGIMPNPGSGVSGDSPQEVLFLVTDGVEDANVKGSRQQSVVDTSWCSIVKNRGIRIAVIYTTYLPLPTNSWYNTYIAPFQSEIGPTLQSCASPGLYFEVNTNQDISAAMSALFVQALQSAYLSK